MRHRLAPRRHLFVLALAALPLLGCGGKSLNPVSGKVLRKGAPVGGALVIFHPVNDSGPTAIRPSGLTAEDGTYRLTTSKPGDGAPPGDYVVSILWEKKPAGAPGGMGGGESKSEADALGGRYATPARSPLRATIKSGPNVVDAFDVE